LEKTIGTGTTSIGVPWVNDGTVHAEGGRLRFTIGGAPATAPVLEPSADPGCLATPADPSNGTWTTALSNNASIELAGGCDVFGTGTVLGGTLRVNGASLTFTDPAPAGTSASSTLAIDTGSIWLTAGSTLAVTRLELAGGTITNAGSLNVSGALDWTDGRSTGLGTAGTCASVRDASGSPGDQSILINTGDLIKDGAGTIMINVPTINTGTVTVNNGDIHFNDGGEDITDDVVDGPEVTPAGRELSGHSRS
jgi:hypothetical protein